MHAVGVYQAFFVYLSRGYVDSSSHGLVIEAGGRFCNVYEVFIA